MAVLTNDASLGQDRTIVKAPQNIDASQTAYKQTVTAGISTLWANNSATSQGAWSTEDIRALAVAGMLWIGRGTDVAISSFDNSTETTKVKWILAN